MNTNEVIINKTEHEDIYKWLFFNVNNYMYDDSEQKKYTLNDGVINVNGSVDFQHSVKSIDHPFGVIKGYLSINGCTKLTSLVNLPKEVGGYFDCRNCKSLTSLIGSPEKVKGDFDCRSCKLLFSFIGLPKVVKNIYMPDYRNGLNADGYKIYLAMWLEFLESVSNEERLIYINSYKDKKNQSNRIPIIPIEILKEYGF